MYCELGAEQWQEAYEQIKAEHESKENAEEPAPEGEQIESHSTPEQSTPERPIHPPDPPAVSKTQADTIYHVILDLREAGHLAKRQLTLDLVISTLVERFSIDNHEYAMDLISARAKTVLDMMDEAKTANFDWSRKAIYRELRNASKRKKDTQNITLTPLRPRVDERDESSNESEEHDELPRPRRRRVRKSLLRPKLSSVSAKQIGKRTRSTALNNDDLSDEDPRDEMINDFATPSKVRGHELVRDPLSTTRAKRTRSILSDADSTPVVPAHRKTPLREILQSRNTSVSGDTPDADAIHSLPDDPEQQQRTDTWTCQVRGCGEIIHESTSKRGKELVQAHSSGHAVDTQEKLDLVAAEKELNIGLPVDNLLSRIREMGAGFPVSDILSGMNGAAAANGV